MRRGAKLAAAAMVAAIMPLPAARADEAYGRFEIVREVEISGNVRHLATGKTGTMKLVVLSRQGVDVRKVPTGSADPGGYQYQLYAGLPVQAAGLARYDGCLTLKIVGVADERDQCQMLDAQITTDPAMNETNIVATVQQRQDEWSITTAAKLEASSNPEVTDPGSGVTPTTEDRLATCQKSLQEYNFGLAVPTGKETTLDLVCYTALLEVNAGRQLERKAIVRLGSVVHQHPGIGFIELLPATFKAATRVRLAVDGYVDRSKAVCFTSKYVVLAVGCYG